MLLTLAKTEKVTCPTICVLLPDLKIHLNKTKVYASSPGISNAYIPAGWLIDHINTFIQNFSPYLTKNEPCLHYKVKRGNALEENNHSS